MHNKEFEDYWLNKTIEVNDNFYGVPYGKYHVTAVLYDYDNRGTLFAIKHENYSKENPIWYTITSSHEKLLKELKKITIKTK